MLMLIKVPKVFNTCHVNFGCTQWIVKKGYEDLIPQFYSIIKSKFLTSCIIAKGWRGFVSELSLNNVNFVFKVFDDVSFSRIKQIYHSFKYLIFLTPAEKEWTIAQSLFNIGVSVPEPIATGVEKCKGFARSSYFVCKKIQGSNLKEFFERIYPTLHPGLKQAILEKLASFVLNVHSKGVFQRDFGWTNILISFNEWEKQAFYLIDFEEVKIKPNLKLEEKLFCLARLNISLKQALSLPERASFFMYYIQNDSHLKVHYDTYLQMILRAGNLGNIKKAIAEFLSEKRWKNLS